MTYRITQDMLIGGWSLMKRHPAYGTWNRISNHRTYNQARGSYPNLQQEGSIVKMTTHDVLEFVRTANPESDAFVVHKALLVELLACAEQHYSRPVAAAISLQQKYGPIWNEQVIREYY